MVLKLLIMLNLLLPCVAWCTTSHPGSSGVTFHSCSVVKYFRSAAPSVVLAESQTGCGFVFVDDGILLGIGPTISAFSSATASSTLVASGNTASGYEASNSGTITALEVRPEARTISKFLAVLTNLSAAPEPAAWVLAALLFVVPWCGPCGA